MTPGRKKALLCLALLVLSFIAYGHLLAKGKVLYSPHSDLITQHLATKTKLYESVQSGHGLPFWREDQFSGNAAATNRFVPFITEALKASAGA